MPLLTTRASASARAFGFSSATGSVIRQLASEYGTGTDDNIADLVVDSNGFLYTVYAVPNDSNGIARTLVRKYNPNFSLVWEKMIRRSGSADGTNAHQNGPTSLAVDSSGNVYVAYGLAVFAAGMYVTFITKLDSSGTVQWSRYDYVNSNRQNFPSRVFLDRSVTPNYPISFFDNYFGLDTKYLYIVRRSDSGTIAHTRTIYGSNANSYTNAAIGNGAAVYDNSNFYYVIRGNGLNNDSQQGFAIFKFNAPNTYSGGDAWFTSVGSSANFGGFDARSNVGYMGLTKYDNIGNFIVKMDLSGAAPAATAAWQLSNSVAAYDSGTTTSIKIGSSGDVYASGYFTNTSTNRLEPYVMRISSSGTIKWQRKIVPLANDVAPYFWDIDISPDEKYVYLAARVYTTTSTRTKRLWRIDADAPPGQFNFTAGGQNLQFTFGTTSITVASAPAARGIVQMTVSNTTVSWTSDTAAIGTYTPAPTETITELS